MSGFFRQIAFITLLSLIVASVHAASAPMDGMKPSAIPTTQTREVIWSGYKASLPETVYFRRKFNLTGQPTVGVIYLRTNSDVNMWLNGEKIRISLSGNNGSSHEFNHVIGPIYCTHLLHANDNILAIECKNSASQGELWFEVNAKLPDGRTRLLVSDSNTLTSHRFHRGWNTLQFNDSAWGRAIPISDPLSLSLQSNKVSFNSYDSPQEDNLAKPQWDTGKLARIWKWNPNPSNPHAILAGSRPAGDQMILSVTEFSPAQTPLLSTEGFTLFEETNTAFKPFEQSQGEWNYDQLLTTCNSAMGWGNLWGASLQLAFPPDWYAKSFPFSRIQCIQPPLVFQAFSPWDLRAAQFSTPLLDNIFDRFQKTPPSLIELRPLPDLAHYPGDWCADTVARQRFQTDMLAKYGSLDNLNRSWGTDFTSTSDITYPYGDSISDRWRLDFAQWYQHGLCGIYDMQAKIFRRKWRDAELALPTNRAMDQSLLASVAARYHADIRYQPSSNSHLSLEDELAFERASTACHFYGVPIWWENMGPVNASEEMKRFWLAESLGCKGFTDTASNALSLSDVYFHYSKYMKTTVPSTDVAMFYPSASHKIYGNSIILPLEQGCHALLPSLRFDVIDERLIDADALSRYHVLILWGGARIPSAAYQRIADWVSKGGILISYNFGKILTVNGDASYFNQLFGNVEDMPEYQPDLSAPADQLSLRDISLLKTRWMRSDGNGWTIYFPGGKGDLLKYILVVRYVLANLGSLLPNEKNEPILPDMHDGLYISLYPDHLFCFNPTDQTLIRGITSPAIVGDGVSPGAAPVSIHFRIDPHSLLWAPLSSPVQELLFECEKFTNLNGQKTYGGSEYSPGIGMTHVLVKAGNQILTRIDCDLPGSYEIYYRTLHDNVLAPAEILVDGVPLRSSNASNPSKVIQTLRAGRVALSKGIHTLVLRAPKVDLDADFVIIGNDKSIAGYCFRPKELENGGD